MHCNSDKCGLLLRLLIFCGKNLSNLRVSYAEFMATSQANLR